MNYNPYDPAQPQQPQQYQQYPQQPQQPQYQQYPQQPQYQQYPQQAPRPQQYAQPRPAAPRPQPVAKSGSDGALLTFVLIFFIATLTMIIMRETCRFNSSATRTIYGIFAESVTLSYILIPLGFKSTGMKVLSFILIGLLVMYLFLDNLVYFGVSVF